jgi:octaprenyl-diphosphate synthase
MTYADAADAALAALPGNAYVDALRGLARYSVSRDH